MAIEINDDGTVTFTGAEAQEIVSGVVQEITDSGAAQATGTVLEQIITDASPGTAQTIYDGTEIIVQTVSDSIIKDMYIVDHAGLLNLDQGDPHPQYLTEARGDAAYTPLSHSQSTNPHNLDANNLPGISPWGTRLTPADLQFILDNMDADSIPSTRIANLVAGKITSGRMAARIIMGDMFTASQHGSVLNDTQEDIALTDYRIQMGFITDPGDGTTYMLRHCNGYPNNNPFYKSNFSIDEFGNVKIAGSFTIEPTSTLDGSSFGTLATRNATTHYGPTEPVDKIIGDIWYDSAEQNAGKRWNGVSWDSVKDSDIAVAQGAIDGKIKTYFQPTMPPATSSADNGDLWFDTNDGNRIYMYDHSAVPKWQDAQDSGIAQGIGDAATAKATADGKVTTYVSPTAPTVIEGVGDLWYKSDQKILYRANTYPVSLVYDASEWDTVSNAFDTSSLLSDDAGWSQTALWDGVTGSGKPSDFADVTNVGGANYVLRYLIPPNQHIGITDAVNPNAAGNWEFTLPDSTATTKQMVFYLPPLQIDTDYVLTFWASCAAVNGTDMVVELFPSGLPDYVQAVTTTPTKYQLAFRSSDLNMANAVLRFNKMTVSTNPADPITIYDVKFEKGTQPTDWTPFNPVSDKADGTGEALTLGVFIDSGGIIIGSGGAFNSDGKNSFADTTSGFYIGYDATEADHVVNIGDANNYLKWNGTNLSIAGEVIVTNSGLSGNQVFNSVLYPYNHGWNMSYTDNCTFVGDVTWYNEFPPNMWAIEPAVAVMYQNTGVGLGDEYDLYDASYLSIANAIPVVAGERYEFSFLSGSHRCQTYGQIYWKTENGTWISSVFTDINDGTLDAGKYGGVSLDGWYHHKVFATAPVNCVKAGIRVMKGCTTSYLNHTNSYGFYARLFFGRAGTAQTEASEWSPGPVAPNVVKEQLGLGTTISGGGITLSSGGAIKGGQTAYNTETGFFLGYESGNYKFSIGDGIENFLAFDGSDVILGPASILAGADAYANSNFYYVTYFDSLDGWFTDGWHMVNMGGWVYWSTFSTDSADMYRNVLGAVDVKDWSYVRKFKAKVARVGVNPSAETYYAVFGYWPTGSAVGFKVVNGTLYGLKVVSGTQTTVALTESWPFGDAVVLECHYEPDGNIYFFVDGVSAGSTTSPSSSSMTTGGSSASLQFSYDVTTSSFLGAYIYYAKAMVESY